MSNGAADLGLGEIAPIVPGDMDEVGEHFRIVKMYWKERVENELPAPARVVSGPACAMGGG